MLLLLPVAPADQKSDGWTNAAAAAAGYKCAGLSNAAAIRASSWSWGIHWRDASNNSARLQQQQQRTYHTLDRLRHLNMMHSTSSFEQKGIACPVSFTSEKSQVCSIASRANP